MTSLYRQILKKAWYITKKYFYLWPLGFFVSFLGNSGEYQILTNQIKKIQNQPETVSNLKAALSSSMLNFDISLGEGFLFGLLIVVILAVLALLVWLIISSVGGLIQGSANASQEKRDNFSTLLSVGSKKFGPILGLYIIAKVIIYGVLALILTPLILVTFVKGNYVLNVLIVILTFLIFIPLTIIISFVTRYASAYVILRGQKMWQSFKNGWRLFTANWLVSLEMALILLIINSLIALVILIIAFLLFSPFFFIGIISAFQNPNSFWSIITIPLFISVIITIIAGSGLATFQFSSWTLLFLRLSDGKKSYSKLVRLIAAIPKKIKKKS
ncbi:hypothetical protein KKF32_00500 [Patescibacteria group bacterium]|nr:hypothetical protein [Patescibacteria group bacterium]